MCAPKIIAACVFAAAKQRWRALSPAASACSSLGLSGLQGASSSGQSRWRCRCSWPPPCWSELPWYRRGDHAVPYALPFAVRRPPAFSAAVPTVSCRRCASRRLNYPLPLPSRTAAAPVLQRHLPRWLPCLCRAVVRACARPSRSELSPGTCCRPRWVCEPPRGLEALLPSLGLRRLHVFCAGCSPRWACGCPRWACSCPRWARGCPRGRCAPTPLWSAPVAAA